MTSQSMSMTFTHVGEETSYHLLLPSYFKHFEPHLAMPTASQAMILMGEDGFDSKSHGGRIFHEGPSHTDISFTQVDVGNPRKNSRERVFVAKEDTVVQHLKTPGTVPQHIDMKGYQGSMYYDPETKRFRWFVAPAKDNVVNANILKTATISKSSIREKPTPSHTPIQPTQQINIPHEAEAKSSSHKSQKLLTRRNEPYNKTQPSGIDSEKKNKNLAKKCGVDDNAYTRLEELGFRRRISTPSPSKKVISETERTSASSPSLERVNKFSGIVIPQHSYPSASSPSPPRYQTPRDVIAPSNSPKDGLNKTFTIEGESALSYRVPYDEDSDEEIVSVKTLSLLDEIKQKISYDNRLFPAMTMRRELPPNNPRSVCFSLRDPKCTYNHSDVKEIIEAATGSHVTSLQYDAVSVRGGCTSDVGSRWIATLPTTEECKKLTLSGLKMGGEKIIVKWYDDVILYEHDAYNIHHNSDILLQKRAARKKRQQNRSKVMTIIKA